MAFRTRIYRWLVGMMAFFTGHFPQVVIMRIMPKSTGLHGQLLSIAMTAETDGRRNDIFWWTFLMAGCTIQSLCTVLVR